MTKVEFLTQLRTGLQVLPQEERDRSCLYYAEMIADRMEDGMTEDEAVAAVGTVEQAVRTVLGEVPPDPTPIPERPKKMGIWTVLLLILGSPVWVSLLVAFIAVLLSVYIVLWSVVITLFGVFVSVLFCGIVACIVSVPTIVTYAPVGVSLLGGGLFWIGLGLYLFLLARLSGKGLVKLTVVCFRGMRHYFFGRKEPIA